jgi:hypothetical protein
MFAEIAASLASDTIKSLILKIVAVQDEQVQLMTELKEDVDRLSEGPWRTSRYYLEDAANAPGAAARNRALEDARRALYEAAGLAADASVHKAAVAGELALVLALLNQKEDAAQWASRSLIFAEEHAAVVASKAQHALRTWGIEWRRVISYKSWALGVPDYPWIWVNPMKGEGRQLRSLQARIIPLLEQGVELPSDKAALELVLPNLSRYQRRVVRETLTVGAIQLLYGAHRAARAVDDYESLCSRFGVSCVRGHLRVDLSTQHKVVVYETPE